MLDFADRSIEDQLMKRRYDIILVTALTTFGFPLEAEIISRVEDSRERE